MFVCVAPARKALPLPFSVHLVGVNSTAGFILNGVLVLIIAVFLLLRSGRLYLRCRLVMEH